MNILNDSIHKTIANTLQANPEITLAEALNRILHAPAPRPLDEIAAEIAADWRKPYFGAVPYLRALASLRSIEDTYGCDPAREIVNYFLANAMRWRGPVARRVKAELREILAGGA